MNNPTLLRIALLLILSFTFPALAKSRDLGNGFFDHGVCAPISQHRGTVATTDGLHDVVLSLLMDHRGGYELLFIDVDSGKWSEHTFPFNNPGDSPFSSILSREGKFYTHFGSHFLEFDLAKRVFTFNKETPPMCAMSMTEDDKGVIWSATYPNCGVVSFDPRSGKFRDYGSVYSQNWGIYPRSIAADDTGWIYLAIGNAATQMLALDPVSGKVTPILDESHRPPGMANLYRDLDGKVYGRALDIRADASFQSNPWWEFYRGEAKEIGKDCPQHPKPYITGSQALFHDEFPDGKKLKTFDLENRHLVVEDQNGHTNDLHFDYASEGAIVMSVIASPQGTITGGTTFPMRCFTFDPRTDTMTSRPAFHQWNAVGRSSVASDHHIFIAAYPQGYLLDWNTDEPWVETAAEKSIGNPRALTNWERDTNRPTCVVPLADGKTVIMGATPDYGLTGGGLLFWNRQNQQQLVLTDKQVIPDQSTDCLLQLDGQTVLGGTTTAAGSGGEKKAGQAELYLLNLNDHHIEWHKPIISGVQSYQGLHRAGNFIVGVADYYLFFVFDPAKREVIYQHNFGEEFGSTAGQQGPRVFVTGPNGEIYLLATHAIAQVELGTWNLKPLVKPHSAIGGGGDYLDGEIYFISGSHLFSWQTSARKS